MTRIPLADFDLSPIAYGTMRLFEMEDTSPAAIRARTDAALEAGITSLDCADIYGGYTVEGLLGAVFKADPTYAENFEIITKCGIQAPWGTRAKLPVKYYDSTSDYIHAQVERSLKEMAIERIDLLLIHRPDPLMDAEDTGRALDALISSGKVRSVGVSNFKPWDISLLQSRMAAPLQVNQIEASLSHLDPFTDGDLAFAQEHQILPMAWSPLGGGKGLDAPTLVSMAKQKACTPGQLALAFLLAHPAGLLPVIGTNRPERIAEAAAATDIQLSRIEWFQLYESGLGKPVP
jgi:predicted oxidoreductase